MTDDNDRIVIPKSTKWDVGLSAVTLVFVVGSIITALYMFNGTTDFYDLSPFLRLVLIGSAIGVIFGAAAVAFNFTVLVVCAIGSIIWATSLTLWEKFKEWRRGQNK